MDDSRQPDQTLVEAALKLPPEQRAAWLASAIGEDPQRRERIEILLQEEAGTASSPPAAESAPRSTMVVSLPPTEIPGATIGRYKLLEKRGQGGMGTVWAAEQLEPVRRRVALKVIKLGMDTRQVIARFEAERQALAMMDHPNIAKVFDAGATETGRPYFVMELVAGEPLTEYCDRHNLNTGARLDLFILICDAIQHAHQKGIIHRDIKPSNILVMMVNGQPVPKVIDFGIAKATSGQQLTDKTIYTALEQFIGTPAYISPEQAENTGLEIDTRSDIYSLGVLLYELLTGRTPFDAARLVRAGLDEIRRIIREEDPPRPSTRLGTLSAEEQTTVARRRQCAPPSLIHLIRGDLDWIVMKCLEKDRTRRYATADALAKDVQRYLRHEPILARPPSPWYRLQKVIRRNRQVLAVAGAAIILTALAAVLLFPTLRLSGQREPLSADQKLSRAEKGLEHYDQGANLAAAMSDLNEIAPAESDNAQYWGKRGWAHWLVFERDDTEEALSDADHFSSRALKCNDKNPDGHLVQGLVAKARHQWLEATNHLLTAKNLTHSVDGLVLISLASACRAAGDRSNALAFAELAEQNTGNRWEVFDRIGTFRYLTDPRGPGLDRALTNFQAAVRLAPESPLAHRHLGQILLVRQAADQASKELDQSLKLSRTAPALNAVGTVYYSAGQRRKALAYHSEAIRAAPGNYIYQVAAGLDLWEPLSSFPEADEHFAKALLQIGTLPDLGEKPLPLAYQGLCHAALRQKDLARTELELALSKAARDHNVLRVIRRGYQILGDRAKGNEIEKLLDQNED